MWLDRTENVDSFVFISLKLFDFASLLQRMMNNDDEYNYCANFELFITNNDVM